MIEIEEISNKREFAYRKIYRSEKEKFKIKDVILKTVRIKKKDLIYILLYDSNEMVVRDVYKYLNVELLEVSENTRNITASALKFIYSYLDLFNITLEGLDKNKLMTLKDFLYGISGKGNTVSYKLLTSRDSETVNKYISILRGYLKFLGIENKFINNKDFCESIITTEWGDIKTSRYKISERVVKHKTVPKYINENEFQRIIDVIQSLYSKEDEIIVRLMYENGLRIGEDFGITVEDIYNDIIIIRNRLSDKWDQKAKTCLNPKSRRNYKSKEYRAYGYGYQVVKISKYLRKIIEEYIEESHEVMSKANRQRYIKYSAACKVDENSDLEGDNYYLFLNSICKPLRSGAWNKRLRTIFLKAGLNVDKICRENNLNHRFRHGFAMKNLKEGKTLLQLKELMRHRSITVLNKYLNPTREEIFNTNNEIARDFNMKFGVDQFDRK